MAWAVCTYIVVRGSTDVLTNIGIGYITDSLKVIGFITYKVRLLWWFLYSRALMRSLPRLEVPRSTGLDHSRTSMKCTVLSIHLR